MSTAFRLGVFIVGALLILSLGIFLIGRKQFLFSSTYRLKADFQSVAGLNNGADVRVGGIHEGTVKEIDLDTQPDTKLTVVMTMDNSTRNVIRKDSIATIKTEGLLGNKFVEISYGSPKAGSVQDGDFILSKNPVDISDLADAAAAHAKNGAAAFQENMEALKHNFLVRGYFKKRGYEDPGELTKHEVSRLPKEARSKEFVYDAKQIVGKPDSARLRNRKVLNEAGKFLQENHFNLSVIAVSADRTGDTDKDRTLTEARAKVVRDYLVQNFKLDDTRLKTLGLGKAKEASDTSRIRILVYGAQPDASSGQNQTASAR
jgi:phospholipid/cholesterol/gamma-HCH transport system substrate-binding protein